MSDVGRYGVTQHADADMMTADQLVGERIGATIGDAVAEGAGPAFLSTAPYYPNGRIVTKMCAKEGCGNYHLRGERFCRHHLEQQ